MELSPASRRLNCQLVQYPISLGTSFNPPGNSMRIVLTVVFILFIWPGMACAAVYKCTDASGRTSFSDIPCATGNAAGNGGTSPYKAGAEPAIRSEANESYTKDLRSIAADAPTQACFDSVNTTQNFPDPSSSKLLSSQKKIVAVKNVGARQMVTIEVTSTNKQGVYVGIRNFKCLLMGDGLTVNTRPYELL